MFNNKYIFKGAHFPLLMLVYQSVTYVKKYLVVFGGVLFGAIYSEIY